MQSPRRRQLVLGCLSCCALAGRIARAAGPGLALTTILDGEAALIRGDTRFALAEGVPLQADDLIELPADPATRLLRIEFASGVRLDLGPGSRLLLAPRLGGERAGALGYLQRGWAKVGVPTSVAAASLLTPIFDGTGIAGSLVLAVLPEGAQAFAESGEAGLRFTPGASPLPLRGGQWLSLPSGSTKPQLQAHPGPGFVGQVPRSFLDALPARAGLFAGKTREPKSVGAIRYADAQPWLDDAQPALRRLALARWRGLARRPEFRSGLVGGLKAHPEWQPVLFPPPEPKSEKS